ncbi:MAG: hypothetical protein OEW37_03730 [Rhodospirillaceae bacterium]|nr:hypothetical protein [Rhodospirillaceae bacterium]
MRKIGIAFAVMLMIAGGVFSALKTFEVGPFEKTAEQLALEASQQSSTDKKITAFGSKPYYLEMDPLLIPVFQGNELAGTIQIIYKMEVFGNENYKSVEKLRTKLGDALIKDFTYYIPRTLRKNQTLDIPLIKYRLKMVADKVLGKDVVSDAIIQGMTQIAPGGG